MLCLVVSACSHFPCNAHAQSKDVAVSSSSRATLFSSQSLHNLNIFVRFFRRCRACTAPYSSRSTSKYHWCRSLDNTTSSSTCKYCFKNRRGTLRCEKQGQVGAISTAGANTTVSRIIDPDCDCGMGMNAQRSCRHAGSLAEKHATPPKAYLCKILL